jgi:hypothetical protein
MRPFRRQIQSEEFDGDEAVLLGLIRAKDGAESTGANLVKYTKRSECVRRRGTGSVRVQ